MSTLLRIAVPAVCVSRASAWSCHIRSSGTDGSDLKTHAHMRLGERVVSGDAQLDLSDVMMWAR